MPRGKKLTEGEKNKIDVIKEKNMSIRKIALELKRSRTVVQNYIKLGDKYRSRDNHGRKKKTDERTKRRIIRAVNCGVGSIKKIKDSLQLSESQTTIRNILKNTGTFRYAKIKKKPRLGPSHIKARLEFAKKSLQNRFDW